MAQDSHTPPKGVQKVGKRAVGWIEDGKAGRNFTQVGRDRAHQLAEGRRWVGGIDLGQKASR